MPANSRNRLHAIICMGAVFVLMHPAGLYAFEVPAGLYGELADEDFKVREKAQAGLLEWARHKDPALEALYKKAITSDDPEQATRCMDILRQLVGESFDEQGQGFVGIQMADAKVRHPRDGGEILGVRVTHLLQGFPAEKSGMRVGDIILSCNGRQVPEGMAGMVWLPEEIRAISPKTLVSLEVLRDDKLLKFDIRLVRRPDDRNLGMFERPRQQVRREQEQAREAHFQRWLRQQEKGG